MDGLLGKVMFKKKPQLSIEQKAKKCADLVADYSKMLANGIKGDEGLTNKQFFVVYIYCTALNYIVIDRQAFGMMNDNEREIFSDYMHLGIQADISRGTGLKKETVMELLNMGVVELSPYSRKLMPEGDESPAGTLYWEFAKLVAEKADLPATVALTSSLMAMQTGVSMMKDFLPVLKAK